MQGTYSASPQIAAFSQQALLSIEGLIHPRAGATVLQSDRSHPYHPPTQESGAVTNISMPRIWSALIPESYVQQEPNTTGASQQQPLESKAAASAAKQVLVAGRVYNEAMQQLETALKGNVNSTVSQHAALSAEGAAPHVDPAAQTEQPVATMDPALGQQPVEISAQSTDVQAIEQPETHTTKLTATEMPVVQEHLPEESQHERAHVQADGMGTSQEAEAKLDDGYISLLPSSGLPAGRNLQPETSQAVGMLADAESSDSQGSLPEIDSGESNSDSDDGMSD